MLSVTGEPGKMPMRPGVQTADVFGALFATYATLASLVGAARNGEGRIADVSLVEASIAAAAWEAAEYLETSKVPQPMGNRHRLTAPYQLFETSDERYRRHRHAQRCAVPQIHAGARAGGASERSALCLLRQAQDQRGCAAAAGRARDPHARTPEDLELALMVAGVPCARVNNFKEVFDDPQIVARGVVQEIEHPRLGQMRTTRNPVLLDHDGPEIDRHSRRCSASIRKKCCRSSAIRRRRSGPCRGGRDAHGGD